MAQDDTGRLQRSINTALSLNFSGGPLTACTVYLPEGTYNVSGTLYLDGNNPTGAAPWNATRPQ